MKRILYLRQNLGFLKRHILQNLDDLKEVVEMTEHHLKNDMKRLEKRVSRELEGLSKEEQEYEMGWYTEDFVRLDEVYPNIQRRALFTTIMFMTEANLTHACKTCQRAFDLPEFKSKGRNRVIDQAYDYLKKNLAIRERHLKQRREKVQHLWTLRNAFVHNDGMPKRSDLAEVTEFCKEIETIDLDDHNRILLRKGSADLVLHIIYDFFSLLLTEIYRNKNNMLSEKAVYQINDDIA